MAAPACVALVDLGFGDAGKGRFTDAWVRSHGAHTVVRFNGGAQAGHNVVLPDGRHHTFSQWGAGSFVPGVVTVLAAPVVVHPGALHHEAAALARVGVADAWQRLRIDARCRVTTPYLQAAGRLREHARGTAAHGSCGVGFGETVALSLAQPGLTLHYADLAHPARAMARLREQQAWLQAQWPHAPSAAAADDWATLQRPELAEPWLALAHDAWRRAPGCTPDALAAQLAAPGGVVFEGAQGVLLDEEHGFHPHTTWSRTTPAAAEAVLADLGLRTPLRRYGILRSYLTRHGAGPFPTQDAALDGLPEPHNGDDGFQGRFRRGHPDAVLLRHAVAACGPLDGLLVSHLDALPAGLRWCHGYRTPAGDTASMLPADDSTAWLQQVRPEYAAGILDGEALLARLAHTAGAPIAATSDSPRPDDVQWHATVRN
ncbi:adenylosuccinate synthetase [Roseateles sp.]|uniref:adenylosuccinate synthetase n=1 Tax=Roseateles sp. TaxID=1971397 RepID=UPI0026893297